MEKWDSRFIQLAEFIANWSLDPSTRVGAIISREKRVISLGYNGFPAGVLDSPERLNNRELKLQIVVHAERNALLFARESLVGCTIYTYPFAPCTSCSSMIIQSGITRIVAPRCPSDKAERWAKDLKLAGEILNEAGVKLDILG